MATPPTARATPAAKPAADDEAEFKELPGRDMLYLAAQRDQPQDGGQRAGHGEIWSEIYADEDRSRDMLRDPCGLADGRGDQPHRQVVDEVGCDGNANAGDPGCDMGCGRGRAFQDLRERRQYAGPVQSPATGSSAEAAEWINASAGRCHA
jgi:hypothetical protein